MKIISHILLFLIIGLFINCATIVKGSKQKVSFVVTGEEEAKISLFELLEQSEKKLSSGQSGFQYELPLGKGYFKKAKYKVKARKGNRKVEKILESKINWLWYVGGNIIVAGPVTGMIGYLGVDPYTGAMWKFPVDAKDQIVLDFASESILVDKSEKEDLCDIFQQKVVLKNKEILSNVAMGIIPNYVVVFTREGKTWVYPKTEVKSAENTGSQNPASEDMSCDYFKQTVNLKKGDAYKETIAAVTSDYIVFLKKDGKVLVYPKTEVQNIENE